jgi:hypothetical protein
MIFVKKQDIYLVLLMAVLFLPFILSRQLFSWYLEFNHVHGLVTSFVKFAILATLGELIGLRIKTGAYYMKGFGILPRMLVWGLLGITIKMAFVIFAVGIPAFMDYCGFHQAGQVLKGTLTIQKVAVAFCVSAAMNLIYAPVMMTFHKITDTHILSNGGTLIGFFKPIQFRKIFINLNWDVQWNFVFKKTIPFFWIPAHTITFLLPTDFQVLFAALLGIALGAILAVADRTKKD